MMQAIGAITAAARTVEPLAQAMPALRHDVGEAMPDAGAAFSHEPLEPEPSGHFVDGFRAATQTARSDGPDEVGDDLMLRRSGIASPWASDGVDTGMFNGPSDSMEP